MSDQKRASKTRGAPPGVGPGSVFAAVSFCVSVLALWRLRSEGVAPYGSDGAEYIEHVERLRVLALSREIGWTSPWDILVTADRSFPPLMHLMSAGIGELFGHGATSAAATGLLWLLLLALATCAVAATLTGERRAGFAAATATFLVPALSGAAIRYYYDLPMTALLWASTAAIMLGFARRRPVVGGLTAGLLLAAAALTKWPALAFGAPLLLAVAVTRLPDTSARWRPRLLGLMTAVITAALPLFAFLAGRGDQTSFASMTRVALDPATPDSWSSDWPGPIGLLLRSVSGLGIDTWGLELGFYGDRMVHSVLGLPLALLATAALLRWLLIARGQRRLAVVTLAGQGLFLLGIVPLLDDRFLLTAVPLVAVISGQAWATLPPAPRRLVAVLSLCCGLLATLDFHVGRTNAHYERANFDTASHEDFPCVYRILAGVAGSVERRGWSRRDVGGAGALWPAERCEVPPASFRGELRETAWQAIERALQGLTNHGGEPGQGPILGLPHEQPMFGPEGDEAWFRYRSHQARLGERNPAIEVRGVCPADGHLGDDRPPPELLLYSQAGGFPSCLPTAGWEERWAGNSEDSNIRLILLARVE